MNFSFKPFLLSVFFVIYFYNQNTKNKIINLISNASTLKGYSLMNVNLLGSYQTQVFNEQKMTFILPFDILFRGSRAITGSGVIP